MCGSDGEWAEKPLSLQLEAREGFPPTPAGLVADTTKTDIRKYGLEGDPDSDIQIDEKTFYVTLQEGKIEEMLQLMRPPDNATTGGNETTNGTVRQGWTNYGQCLQRPRRSDIEDLRLMEVRGRGEGGNGEVCTEEKKE